MLKQPVGAVAKLVWNTLVQEDADAWRLLIGEAMAGVPPVINIRLGIEYRMTATAWSLELCFDIGIVA